MSPVYLVDNSAIQFLERPEVFEVWKDRVVDGQVGICSATRLEMLYSARSDQDGQRLEKWIRTMFTPVPIPQTIWDWSLEAQRVLRKKGQHRSAGAVDLILCGTATHHSLVILHNDKDYQTVSRVLPEVKELRIV